MPRRSSVSQLLGDTVRNKIIRVHAIMPSLYFPVFLPLQDKCVFRARFTCLRSTADNNCRRSTYRRRGRGQEGEISGDVMAVVVSLHKWWAPSWREYCSSSLWATAHAGVHRSTTAHRSRAYKPRKTVLFLLRHAPSTSTFRSLNGVAHLLPDFCLGPQPANSSINSRESVSLILYNLANWRPLFALCPEDIDVVLAVHPPVTR